MSSSLGQGATTAGIPQAVALFYKISIHRLQFRWSRVPITGRDADEMAYANFLVTDDDPIGHLPQE
ncbi:hypothetical protein [Halomicronema sp. CCY15110]|uniref:hypothetical protein n=1 Tax=Halomicronema sp. CCY15110 TaxID=2767773 RepID=UPI00195097FB|nr:hypothetical protein [Halomicronema sp. CCY15110]